ncbi:MAG: CHAT domain-containing protein, partial [Cyclobacteriaceae bacterium]|nr:CHAT domain-containing protein [Cyclobacteriaceae bacterium]
MKNSKKYIFWTLIIVFTSCKTPSIIATTALHEGDKANNENRYEQAITYYQQYIEISPKLGLYRNPVQEAETYRKLAHAYSANGEYAKSKDVLFKAINIDSLNKMQIALVENHQMLAAIYSFEEDYKRSIEYLDYCLKLTEEMGNGPKEIKTKLESETNLLLARVKMVLGDFPEAQFYASVAQSGFTKTGNKKGLLESKYTVSVIARDRGDYFQAEKAVNESVLLAQELGLSTSKQQQVLGDIYYLKGNPEEAVKYALLAVEEAEKTNIKPQIITSYLRLGNLYNDLTDEESAILYFKKAYQLQSTIDKNTFYNPHFDNNLTEIYNANISTGSLTGAGIAGFKLGEQHLKENNKDSARFYLMRALDLFTEAENVEGKDKTSLLLSLIYLDEGSPSGSLKFLQNIDVLKTTEDLKWRYWFVYGKYFRLSNKKDSAQYAFEKSIDHIEKLRSNLTLTEFKVAFANNKNDVYDHYIELMVQKSHDEKSSELLQKAFYVNELARSRAFLDMLGNKKIDPKNSMDTVLLNLEQKYRLKLNQLSLTLDASKYGTKQRKEIQKEYDEAQIEYNEVLRRLKLQNKEYESFTTVLPPSSFLVQKHLDTDEAIVEFWVGHDQMTVWVLDKENIEVKEIKIPQNQLNRQVIRLRNSVALQDEDLINDSLEDLYEILLQPLENKISKYRQLIIVPHRSLHFVPFQALLKDNRFLVQNFSIITSPSSSVYVNQKIKAVENNIDKSNILAASIGNSNIDTYSNLPGTNTEVSALQDIMGNVVL